MSDSVIINKLVDDILSGDALSAKETFEDAISLKITNALDQRKIELAQQMYSTSNKDDGVDEEEIDIESEDENG